MATGKNFEYLGNTFQLQLLNQIIEFINPLPRNLMLMSFHSMEHQREVMTSPIHAILISEPYYHQLIFPKVEKNKSQLIPYLTDKNLHSWHQIGEF